MKEFIASLFRVYHFIHFAMINFGFNYAITIFVILVKLAWCMAWNAQAYQHIQGFGT